MSSEVWKNIKISIHAVSLARDLKFQVGPWNLGFSKTRIVTISIIITAFLLATANQSLVEPAFHPKGELDIEYTTSIDQNVTYVVDRELYASSHSLVVLNASEISYDGSIAGYLPRFDYDRIVFNLTVHPSNASALASIRLSIDHGDLVEQTATMNISKTTVVSLELNVAHLMAISNQWLFAFYASIIPAQAVTFENLAIWVESTVPLVPVSLDLQTTDGLSLYDNPMFLQIHSNMPFLYISKDSNRLNRIDLWPYKKNVTFYLRPGGLNGTAKWYGWSYPDDFVPFNVAFSLDEKVAIKIRMLVVRIDLNTDSSYPLTSIRIREQYDGWPLYDLYVTPDIFPSFLYVPAHRFASWEQGSQSVSIEVYLKEMRYSSAYTSRALLIASGDASFNGTHDLDVHVNFSQSAFLGIVMTSDLILWALSITLFLLVLVRIGLVIHTSERKMHIDFRLIPCVLFIILSLIPWYSSAFTLHRFDQYYSFTIYSLSMGPIPIVGFCVEGSTIVWTIPSEALVWSTIAIIFYWIPLLWAIFRLSTPSNREGDVKMGLLLFLPSIFAVYVNVSLPEITGGSVSYLTPTLVLPLIPLLWLCLIAVLSRTRRYTTRRNDATRETYSRLKRDEIEPIKDEESRELIPERGSLWLQLFEDFATWRGWFVIILFILLISLPCAVGLYYRAYDIGVVYQFQILPLVSLSEFFNFENWYSIRLAALIIGIPYFVSGLFTILALWRYSRREVSLLWTLLGAFLIYDSLIPGIMTFYYISSINQNIGVTSWFIFEPSPSVAIIFVVISLLLWLKQAYEDADDAEMTTTSNEFDADE